MRVFALAAPIILNGAGFFSGRLRSSILRLDSLVYALPFGPDGRPNGFVSLFGSQVRALSVCDRADLTVLTSILWALPLGAGADMAPITGGTMGRSRGSQRWDQGLEDW